MKASSKHKLTACSLALVALVVACSNETTSQAAVDAGQKVLGALPAAEANAQTTSTPAAQPKPAGTAGPSKPLPKGVYQVQVAEIPDGMTGAPAARVLVPAGWKSEGAMQWTSGTPGCADPAVFAWSATSPDGKSSFQLFPNELWSFSSTTQSPCTYGEFMDLQSYFTAFVQQNVPGATNFQYRQRPDLLEPQREDIAFKQQMVNNSGLGMRFWPDAGELTFSYTENGVKMKGLVGGTGRFYLNQLANPLGGPPLTGLNAQTNSTYAASFPADQFDANLVEGMRKSIKLDIKWAANYMDLLTRMSGQQTQAVKDRAAIIIASGQAMTQATIARNNAAANAAVAKTYADPSPSSSSRDATEDRMQRERIEGVRGVETYDDPVYGGTVQLDSNYGHAWRVNNADSYILTNDPNFNPGLYNIDAQQLKVTR